MRPAGETFNRPRPRSCGTRLPSGAAFRKNYENFYFLDVPSLAQMPRGKGAKKSFPSTSVRLFQ
jgi:hypothetical protein